VSGKTITRADLIEAIHQRIGLSRIKCGELLELVLKEITDRLERGETAKLSSLRQGCAATICECAITAWLS
jgi:integration host factor subunit alpha